VWRSTCGERRSSGSPTAESATSTNRTSAFLLRCWADPYEHPDFRAEIEALRADPDGAPARLPVRQRGSDASLRTRLRAALDDNQRLRQEIARLREELALAHGRELELAQKAGRR
jgi:GrpB-like predicted nucleotidyltransferase (UPF0157 family)